ncbi:MAG: adenylyl-sulfate kinase [Bacteroidales bacterium]|nr:adenylyl-sulfate kinase [Bacteroidales bacterium]
MFTESNSRSLIKTISWRFFATITTAAIVYAFTGRLNIALAVGGIEVILKLILYYFHERTWNKISYGKKEIKPKVIWLTGLSGSGKSTIAEALYKKLKSKGLKAEYLDGDRVRDIFPKTGFSKEERDRHIKRIGFLASILEKNGVIVIAAFISPYEESRQFVKNLCNNFIEVHVSTPLEECKKRDIKGLYAKAESGEIKNFTGIDDPYEVPLHPDLRIDTTNITVNQAVDRINKLV